MILLIIAILAGGGLYLYSKGMGTGELNTGVGGSSGADSSSASEAKPWALPLPDVEPSIQGGNWSTEFDDAFSRASTKRGVPFALLKAHAVRESALVHSAFRAEPASNGRPPSASYGLMQILWWPGSNRFAKWGYNDDLVRDGSPLYDPYVNVDIAAQLIKENYARFQNLRDTVNAYNTGVAENVRVAPNDYVDDVLDSYSTLVGRRIS